MSPKFSRVGFAFWKPCISIKAVDTCSSCTYLLQNWSHPKGRQQNACQNIHGSYTLICMALPYVTDRGIGSWNKQVPCGLFSANCWLAKQRENGSSKWSHIVVECDRLLSCLLEFIWVMSVWWHHLFEIAHSSSILFLWVLFISQSGSQVMHYWVGYVFFLLSLKTANLVCCMHLVELESSATWAVFSYMIDLVIATRMRCTHCCPRCIYGQFSIMDSYTQLQLGRILCNESQEIADAMYLNLCSAFCS